MIPGVPRKIEIKFRKLKGKKASLVYREWFHSYGDPERDKLCVELTTKIVKEMLGILPGECEVWGDPEQCQVGAKLRGDLPDIINFLLGELILVRQLYAPVDVASFTAFIQTTLNLCTGFVDAKLKAIENPELLGQVLQKVSSAPPEEHAQRLLRTMIQQGIAIRKFVELLESAETPEARDQLLKKFERWVEEMKTS